MHVFKDPDNQFRDANHDKIQKIETKKQESIISYQVNEWSSPESIVDLKKNSNKEKQNNKRHRSISKDEAGSKKRHKKKHKKKKKDH